MTKAFGNRQVCEPVEHVKMFHVQVKARKPRRKGGKAKKEIKLVPASLNTPQAQKSKTPSSRPSKRRRVDVEGLKASEIQKDDGNQDWQDEGSLFVPFDLPPLFHGRSNNNDYMRDWKAHKERLYLDEILYAEAPKSQTCSQCFQPSAEIWRCTDCFSSPLYCRSCCRTSHERNPLHRVEVWNSTHFTPSRLWRCGLVLSLCATGHCKDSFTDPPVVDALPAVGDSTFGAKPEFRAHDDIRVLVVVHTNGVHHVLVKFCTCAEPHDVHDGHDDPLDEDIQLLRASLYPASHKEIRTAFTFAVMDNYLLDNLECYTSAFHYFSKLRRMTNQVFPKKVPDRYREGLRCGRQWRRIKELKRHGFGHTKRNPETGEMAHFCAACPQAGKNLSSDWRDEPQQWRHNVTLVADGNFTLVHCAQKTVDDVWLKNGESYMVGRAKYQEHIQNALETKEKPTCHEHRAVEDRSKSSKGCDVTGVGAFACSVVDFQKGERQINMDYGLQGSIHTTGAIHAPRLNLLYDINCQYSVNLRRRFATTETLTLPEDMVIVYGIGQFHVHGHREQCFARYSPSFIDGIGKTSGEILEPLWSNLNPASKPTQTMTLVHRSEVLDAHIADNNWKKLINVAASISSAYMKNLRELDTTREAFELLNDTASRRQLQQWQQQLSEAMEMRVRNVEAMDVLNVAIDKPPSRSKVQHDLMRSEHDLNADLGVTSWISLGIKLQETQLQLKAFIRSLPRLDLRTDQQELEKERRREQLQADIVAFLEDAERLFPGVDFEDYQWFNPPATNPEIDLEIDDDYGFDLDTDSNPFVDPLKDPEDVEIPLPSAFDTLPSSMKSARKKEIQLQIGHKSYLYRSNIRLADGKKQRTRGFAAVKAADRSMRHHIRIYNQTTWALSRLGAPAKIMERFKDVTPRDTKAITAVYDPNSEGSSKDTLSWIWRMNVSGDSSKSPYLEELYRVNWLKAKSLFDRAQEQDLLLRSEMRWVANFFVYKENECFRWGNLPGPGISDGHKAYACRQAETWQLLRSEAATEFKMALEKGNQELI
ncbi:hypothetical protein BKA70DRAFT_1375637 [Coprinopsis sp. MPI-PUGE-AT-0042]|nr:hypothetical protein BKA70DRAFT_1375637 [Coprinopsis sp. MPI-PUGE-AT-0042]